MISICIPAYKRVDYLKRLLDSISVQQFRDFEVIVSDDSPDESVKILCGEYESKFNLRYFKNDVPLGTPENWNQAIAKASGGWVKLMHDDDWFYNEFSLGKFADAAQKRGGDLIFSAYQNVFLDENRSDNVFPSRLRLKLFLKNPVTLLSKNIVGPPSVILHPKVDWINYDKSTKWVVDIDFYIHLLTNSNVYYLPEILICVGMSKEQVTASCSRIPTVEIPENLYLINKIGWRNLENILVFDSLWRLLRNFKIRSTEDIRGYGYEGDLPSFLNSMIKDQLFWGSRALSVGVLSKFAMVMSYFKHKKRFKL